MIAIISPAKNMRQATLDGLTTSPPTYLNKAEQLVDVLKEYNPWELESLLKINPDLGLQAFEYYQNWDTNQKGTPALLAYHGLQYKNIHVEDFTPEDFYFADQHLRMLSGLYGMVKPTNEIHPYRLEMQTKLQINGQDLYGFWGDELYKELYQNNEPVINLASKEYSKAIEPYLHKNNPWINIEFKTYRNGKLRTIATLAKMARGQMIRYMIKNRLEKPEDLKSFDWEGYEFIEELSYENKYVFLQK